MIDNQAPLIVTSISPRMSRGAPQSDAVGYDYQRNCITSWVRAGARVVSVNSGSEISKLGPDYYDVEFVLSTTPDAGGKTLPGIPEMLSVGTRLPHGACFGVANSDVMFMGDAGALRSLFEAARGGVVFANRNERSSQSTNVGLPYIYGFDFFVLDNQFVTPSELEGFFIGSPWWDYLLLYLMATRDVPMASVGGPIISHLTHTQAWDVKNWSRGLAIVAKRIRDLADEEGPAAALLAHICRSFEVGSRPGFAIEGSEAPIGTALGVAMVSYIRDRCSQVLYFEKDLLDAGGGWGDLKRAWQFSALEAVG